MDAVEKLSNKRNSTRGGFLDIHIYIKNLLTKEEKEKIIFACLQIAKKGEEKHLCALVVVYVFD